MSEAKPNTKDHYSQKRKKMDCVLPYSSAKKTECVLTFFPLWWVIGLRLVKMSKYTIATKKLLSDDCFSLLRA